MNCLFNTSSIYFFNSVNSICDILQGAIDIGFDPSIKSMVNSISLSRGNPRTSSRKTSRYTIGNLLMSEISLTFKKLRSFILETLLKLRCGW